MAVTPTGARDVLVPESHEPVAFRFLRYLALVTAILFAVVAIPTSRWGSVALVDVALDVALHTVSSAENGEPPSSPSHWRDGRPRAVLELELGELDGDEDESLCDVPAALSFRGIVLLPGRDCALRGEVQSDTSRFACGTGLPRGPPV